MSEDAYKRRLREWKRRIIKILRPQGFHFDDVQSGAFHIIARRGKTARYIRISFGESHYDEIMMMKREPCPARCIREIWKVTSNGLGVTRAVVE